MYLIRVCCNAKHTATVKCKVLQHCSSYTVKVSVFVVCKYVNAIYLYKYAGNAEIFSSCWKHFFIIRLATNDVKTIFHNAIQG